jgi:hypothetical protein
VGLQRRRPWFAATLLLLPTFLGACASAAPTGSRDAGTVTIMTGDGTSLEIQRGADVRVNKRLAAAPDAAWEALPGVYRTLELETDVRDDANRRLGASEQRISRRFLNRNASDFFECGLDPGLNRPLADQVPITATITTTIVGSGAGTELQTQVQGVARRTGGNAGTATCRSTGLMESLVGEMMERRTGGGG